MDILFNVAVEEFEGYNYNTAVYFFLVLTACKSIVGDIQN